MSILVSELGKGFGWGFYTKANVRGKSDVVWLAKTFVSNKHRKNNKILPATLFFSAEKKLRIAGLNEAQIGSVRNILDVCGLKIQGEDGYMGDFLRM